MSLAIIIPFYNGGQYLDLCINSILAESISGIAIYIIDNSTVQSKHHLLTNKKNVIIYLRTKPSIGFGRACNIGAHKAIADGFEWIIFLNQDTKIKKNSLHQLLSLAKKNPGNYIWSPMILEYNSNQPMMVILSSYLFANKEYFKDTYQGVIKDMYQIPTMGAACIMMHSNLINKIGLFDPVFNMYGEDYDLFKRLEKVKGKLFLTPKAAVHHVAGLNQLDKSFRLQRDITFSIAQIKKKIRYESRFNAFKHTFFRAYKLMIAHGMKTSLQFFFNSMVILLKNDHRIKENDILSIKKRIEQQIQADLLA